MSTDYWHSLRDSGEVHLIRNGDVPIEPYRQGGGGGRSGGDGNGSTYSPLGSPPLGNAVVVPLKVTAYTNFFWLVSKRSATRRDAQRWSQTGLRECALRRRARYRS